MLQSLQNARRGRATPIYEYRCNGCGNAVSLFFRSFSTPVNAVCPSCKSEDMQRLVSRVAILKSADPWATSDEAMDPTPYQTPDWADEVP